MRVSCHTSAFASGAPVNEDEMAWLIALGVFGTLCFAALLPLVLADRIAGPLASLAAMARSLAAAGAKVAVGARSEKPLAALAREIGGLAVPFDVRRVSDIRGAVERVERELGRIDVLVNNAGINVFGPLLEQPLGEVREVFETNVLGLLAVTQAVVPGMADRRHGRVVNLGSVVGVLPTPYAGAYCASKSAVHMLSDVLRMELAPFGIDVVLVQPGGVKSSIAELSGVICFFSASSALPSSWAIIGRTFSSSATSSFVTRGSISAWMP